MNEMNEVVNNASVANVVARWFAGAGWDRDRGLDYAEIGWKGMEEGKVGVAVRRS